MNNGWRAISALVVMFATGFLVGSWTDHWPSPAGAEEKENVSRSFLQLLAHQQMGRHVLFSVYCDAGRGHLVYTYTVAGGESPSASISIVKDGCETRK